MVLDVVVVDLGFEHSGVFGQPAFVSDFPFPGFLRFEVRITSIHLIVFAIKRCYEITKVELADGALERAPELVEIVEIPTQVEARFDVSKRARGVDVDAGLLNLRVLEIQRALQSDVLAHLPKVGTEEFVTILLDVRIRIKYNKSNSIWKNF